MLIAWSPPRLYLQKQAEAQKNRVPGRVGNVKQLRFPHCRFLFLLDQDGSWQRSRFNQIEAIPFDPTDSVFKGCWRLRCWCWFWGSRGAVCGAWRTSSSLSTSSLVAGIRPRGWTSLLDSGILIVQKPLMELCCWGMPTSRSPSTATTSALRPRRQTRNWYTLGGFNGSTAVLVL